MVVRNKKISVSRKEKAALLMERKLLTAYIAGFGAGVKSVKGV